MKTTNFPTTRDVGFANPHTFCIFTKKGMAPYWIPCQRLFVVPHCWLKIVGHPFYLVPNLPPRDSFVNQMLDYEANWVNHVYSRGADQGSAEPACSKAALQKQILSSRIASQKLKIINALYLGRGACILKPAKAYREHRHCWFCRPVFFLSSMPQNCTAPFSFLFAL